jgi:uncharacterized membrane protein
VWVSLQQNKFFVAALIAITTLCWGSIGVVERIALRHVSPQSGQVLGGITYITIMACMYAYFRATGVPIVFNVWGVLWVMVCSILAAVGGLAFAFAMKRAPVHIVTGFTSTSALVAFFLCWLVLHEEITRMKIIGIVLIVLGTVALGV